MDGGGGEPVWVIGRANDIEPGRAKPFSLSRVTETGEARPFAIFVVRRSRNDYVGYLNGCPHGGTWLNINAGEFFSEDRAQLRCGRHGARFEIATGRCVEGPCEGAALEPVALTVLDGDLCICGVELVEDDGLPNPFVELDDTMEIMIHPD
jgi:nitrite reductase/ring-hydroxylating ferredoxin subunit